MTTERLNPQIAMAQTGASAIQKPASLILSALVVGVLSFAPMFLMSHTLVDRYIILCTSMPLSGVCFAWAWRERRRFMVRWAACSFAASFSLWLFFLFYFLFETHDELRGLALVAANMVTNGVLFSVLNRQAKAKDHCDPLVDMAVM